MDTTRTNLTADWTVNEVVAAYPAALPVLGRYGIDTCCGGLKSLREVASVHQLSLDRLLADLESAISLRETILDVRSIHPRQRHELIFETFAALVPGTAFALVNDHDPKPLYYQLSAEHAGEFTWEYQEQGPEVWRVRIGKAS